MLCTAIKRQDNQVAGHILGALQGGLRFYLSVVQSVSSKYCKSFICLVVVVVCGGYFCRKITVITVSIL